MTIQTIIDDIKIRLPNGYTNAQILSWVNNTIEEIWQEIALDGVAEINWTAGSRENALPTDCDFSAINAVVVGQQVYAAKHSPDFTTQNVYFKNGEGKIALNPVPAEAVKVKIYYLKKPTEGSLASNIQDRPEFIELVKSGVLCIIAKSLGEVPLANNYVEDYNMALANAKQRRLLYSAAYPQVRSYQ